MGRIGYSFCPGIHMTEIWIDAIWLMVWPSGQGDWKNKFGALMMTRYGQEGRAMWMDVSEG